MRGVFVTLSSLALVLASFATPAPARAASVWADAALEYEPAPSEDPRQLYEDGRKAYRLGDFANAVDAWERAYAASEKPLLLYNISLAYKGRYTITKDIADLRRAKAVLDNFIKLAEADPDLDLDDAPERMAEIEGLIMNAEEEAGSGGDVSTVPPPDPGGNELRDMPEGADPGRPFRLGGIGAMAGGGVLLLTGAGLASYYILASRDFQSKLETEQNDRQALETMVGMGFICDDPRDNPDDYPVIMGMVQPQEELDCNQIRENIRTYRRNGNLANTRGFVVGGVLGGLALVSIVTGAVLFTEGNRRSRRWEQGIASIRIAPTTRGFVISGRF